MTAEAGRTETEPVTRRDLIRAAVQAAQLVVLLTAVAAIAGTIGLIAVPRVLGWQGAVVVSGSMEPALQTGSVAFIERTPAEDVEVGDVLTYRVIKNDGPVMITHRVVEIVTETSGARQFRTKGDANGVIDAALISEDQVVGTVEWDVPYLGRIVEKLRNHSNLYLFIGLPASLIILSDLPKVSKRIRQPKRHHHIDGAAS